MGFQAFHYTTSISKPDGIFHIRLYSLPLGYVADFGITAHHGMPAHMEYLSGHSVKETKFDQTLVPSGGIGKVSEAYADEFFRGTPEFQNFSLQLYADPVFADLAYGLRKGDEIWCEVVLEQRMEDPPEIPAFAMFFPRKKRLYFWGKIIHQESKGHLKIQELSIGSRNGTPNNLTHQTIDHTSFVARQDARSHYGAINLTFEHWFKVIAAENPRAFLDSYVAPHIGTNNAKGRRSDLLEAMIKWMQPTVFHAVSDWRLACEGPAPGQLPDVSRCNLLVSFFLQGCDTINWATGHPNGAVTIPNPLWSGTGGWPSGVNDLYHIGFFITGATGQPWALFDPGTLDAFNKPKNDEGAYSFYQFKSIGELFIAFCEENGLKCQIELPIMAESWTRPSDDTIDDNIINAKFEWLKCSRWLFFDASSEIFIDPVTPTVYIPDGTIFPSFMPQGTRFVAEQDKVDYAFRPFWLGKLEVQDRSADIFDNIGKVQHHYVSGYSTAGAVDLQITMLFSFIDTSNGTADDPRGMEVLLFDDLGHWVYARWAFIPDPAGLVLNATALGYPSVMIIALYRQFQNSTIELDYKGIGIEKFGMSAKDAPNYIKAYKLDDFGEFPMFREFQANPGILFDPHTESKFRIISIDRTPGETTIGTTHIKALVHGSVGATPPDIPAKQDPPHRHIKTPPAFSGSPVCNDLTIVFCIDSKGDCIDHADVTIDGQPLQMGMKNFPNPLDQDCTPITVQLDTTKLANGAHIVCVTLTCCDGTVIGPTCWSFNVQNPCVGVMNHYWTA